MVRPAVPLQEDPRALLAQQPHFRAAVGGRAVVGHLQSAPVLRRKRSSEKLEVLVTVCGGGEELRRGDRARSFVTLPHTTLPPVAAKLAPEAVSVPVDTSPTVVKFPALSPSSVAKPVRASESASRSVTETDFLLKALAPGCISSEPTFAGLRKNKKENKGS